MILSIHLVYNKQLYILNEMGHIQEQSLLYFYMTSKLQHVGYHGNSLHSVKLMLIMSKVVI